MSGGDIGSASVWRKSSVADSRKKAVLRFASGYGSGRLRSGKQLPLRSSLQPTINKGDMSKYYDESVFESVFNQIERG